MSYQYTFCPTCGIRRVAYGYRCSVCDDLVRRTPIRRRAATVPRIFLNAMREERVQRPLEHPRIAA
jgi:hypothetical protein